MLFLQDAFDAADKGKIPEYMEPLINDFLASAFKAAVLNIPKDDPDLKHETGETLMRLLSYAVSQKDGVLAGTVDGLKMIIDLDGDPDKLKQLLQSRRAIQDARRDNKPEFIQ